MFSRVWQRMTSAVRTNSDNSIQELNNSISSLKNQENQLQGKDKKGGGECQINYFTMTKK